MIDSLNKIEEESLGPSVFFEEFNTSVNKCERI